MRAVLRVAMIAAFGLPLAACISYHEEPRKPAPVVVSPPPPGSGPTVVTPGG